MPQKNPEPDFSDPIIVNSFLDPSDKTKIHPDLLDFQKQVANIAVLDFSEKELRDHYEKDFFRAHITYVKYNGEIIAFFIAKFSVTLDKKEDKIYAGSGFPGIKYKYRNIEKKEDKIIDFKKIMGKLTVIYVKYFYTEILVPTRLNPLLKSLMTIENAIDRPNFLNILNSILTNINTTIKLKQNYKLIITATAENPIMYAALMNMGLDFEGTNPMPSSSDLNKISRWDTETLLVESYRKSLESQGRQHPCLEKPSFVVNIPANEWRFFFVNVTKKNDRKTLFVKYFLWQNFNFPDKAFVFYFNVDIKNIFNFIQNTYK